MNRFYILIIIVFAIGSFVFLKDWGRDTKYLDEFAACLSDKGITMYGVDSCSYCQSEKKTFGDSFRLVSYVECSEDPRRCLDASIAGFPTWILPDGKKLEGEQGLENLSRESGCSLPESN